MFFWLLQCPEVRLQQIELNFRFHYKLSSNSTIKVNSIGNLIWRNEHWIYITNLCIILYINSIHAWLTLLTTANIIIFINKIYIKTKIILTYFLMTLYFPPAHFSKSVFYIIYLSWFCSNFTTSCCRMQKGNGSTHAIILMHLYILSSFYDTYIILQN